MPNVEYTPKASLYQMPQAIRFLGDGYEVYIKEGVNDLSDEQAKHLRENPDVKAIYKDVIHFRQSHAPAKQPESSPTQDISEVKGDELERLIDSTTDVGKLEGWLHSEQRSTVKRKLADRISALKGE